MKRYIIFTTEQGLSITDEELRELTRRYTEEEVHWIDHKGWYARILTSATPDDQLFMMNVDCYEDFLDNNCRTNEVIEHIGLSTGNRYITEKFTYYGYQCAIDHYLIAREA